MKQPTCSLLTLLLAFTLLPGCGSQPSDEYRVVEETETVESVAKKKVEPKKENKETVSDTTTPAPEMAATPVNTGSKPSEIPVTPKPEPKESVTPPSSETKTPTATSMEASSEKTSTPNAASPAGASFSNPPAVASATEMSAKPPAPSDAPVIPTGPLPIKLLIPHKEFTAEGSEQALRVTFDDIDLLKVLNMEPVPEDAADHFPDWLSSLHGKRIILRGWMYPPARQDGISRFMFVRDNGICCFGRAPKIYDKLGVTLRKGVTTPYIQNRPFDVIGTLLIEPEIDSMDEGQSWLYFLQDAIVIDSARS